MSRKKIPNNDWREVEERFQKKLSSWKGKVLSVRGRLVLINSVLSSLPMYLMSFLGYLKVCVRNWTTTGLGSFGKVRDKKVSPCEVEFTYKGSDGD
jgi:hypothetical protein